MIELVSKKIAKIIELAEAGNCEEAFFEVNKLKETKVSEKMLQLLEHIVKKFSLDRVENLAEWDEREVLHGTSIVTCCMNRNENLLKAVETWRELPVDEIVIVDWSSSIPVRHTLGAITDSRIKIIRVENESKWILTYAFNVGLRFARYQKIVKFDADIQVTRDFFEKNLISEECLVRGNWKHAVERGEGEQKYVNGSFVAPKKSLKQIGYYNEFIRTYGWDDSDIYQRLVLNEGLPVHFIDPTTIYHQNQAQEDRLANQDVAKHRLLDKFEATEYYNICNKYLTAIWDDWKSELLSEYKLEKVTANYVVATRITKDREIPTEIISDASLYATSKLLSWADGEVSYYAGVNKNVARIISRDFQAGIPYSFTRKFILKFREELINDTASFIDTISFDNVQSVRPVIKYSKIKHSLPMKINGYDYLIIPSDSFSSFNVSIVGSEKTVLIVSVFDDQNEIRINDYIYCIKENLENFDSVVLVYEEKDGSFLNSVKSALSEKDYSRLIVFVYPLRPTFEYLFDLADAFFNGCYVHISNSDIASDISIREVKNYLDDEKFFVLSRNEVNPKTNESQGLILNSLGVANTFSADMWIYKAPRKYSFKSDFQIGTFHCDSYLNYFIANSGYALYNPCLSVNIFHIHDPVFNSSETKKKVLVDEIDSRLKIETQLNNGIVPLCGARWTDLKSTNSNCVNNGIVNWRDAVFIFRVDNQNYVAILILVLSFIRKNNDSFLFSIWLQIENYSADSVFTSLISNMLAAIDSDLVNITVSDSNEHPLVTTRKAYEISNKEIVSFLLNDQSYADFEQLFYGNQDKFGTLFFTGPLSDFDIYKLNKSASDAVIGEIKAVLTALDDTNLKPHITDMGLFQRNQFDYVNQLALNAKSAFSVSFITSIFKGEQFMKGFLENIAAAAVEVNGKVILLDAKSPQNEKQIFDHFLADNPELTPYFDYIELESDPGLYNCWKLGIERSTTQYVSNANLDDRRSPFQAKVLVDKIKSHSGFKAAATGMRANKVKNASYYSRCEDQYWFCSGYSEEISFENLYYTNQDGLVMSHNILHCMPVWDKSLHDTYGFFDESRYGTSADWAFWLKCTKAGERFLLCSDVLSQYFINESSHNRINDSDGKKENLIVSDFIGIDQVVFLQQ